MEDPGQIPLMRNGALRGDDEALVLFKFESIVTATGLPIPIVLIFDRSAAIDPPKMPVHNRLSRVSGAHSAYL